MKTKTLNQTQIAHVVSRALNALHDRQKTQLKSTRETKKRAEAAAMQLAWADLRRLKQYPTDRQFSDARHRALETIPHDDDYETHTYVRLTTLRHYDQYVCTTKATEKYTRKLCEALEALETKLVLSNAAEASEQLDAFLVLLKLK